MEFAKVIALQGANRWAAVSVLEVLVDFRDWRELRTERLLAFRERFINFLTAMEVQVQPTKLANASRVTVADASRRLVTRVRAGDSMASVLEHTTRLLQVAVGVDASYGETHETDEPQVFRIAFQFEEESLARACLETARQMCSAAFADTEFDLQVEIRKLVDLADDVRLGPSSRAIVQAALTRGIPVRRLNTGSLMQYGEGKFLRRTWTAETDQTSAIGESIAHDKALTKRMLTAAGVPVPKGRPVTDAEDACQAANEIGFPVVVKPRDGNHARGVSLNVTTREQVLVAYDWALTESENVMVEQFARGQQHRLLVVGNRFVAAARGESEFVVGDGQRTIRELVDEVNKDPRRGENYTDLLDPLKIGDIALIELQKQGLTPDSVPLAKQRVLIQQIGDLTTDCTDDVHPEVASRAELAARVVGLDVAGMDVMAVDISRPLEEQRGMILEVNAGPSLGMHIAPLHGQPRPVGEAIISTMFAAGQTGRIPIVVVTGSGPRRAVALEIDSLLRTAGRKTGIANQAGLAYNGQPYVTDARNDRDNLFALLSHPYVDAVIFESRPEQTVAEGFGYGRCDVLVVPALPAGIANGNDDHQQPNELLAVLALIRAVPLTGKILLPTAARGCEFLLRACRGAITYFEPRDNLAKLAADFVLNSSG